MMFFYKNGRNFPSEHKLRLIFLIIFDWLQNDAINSFEGRVHDGFPNVICFVADKI